jgi:hypothetical protein
MFAMPLVAMGTVGDLKRYCRNDKRYLPALESLVFGNIVGLPDRARLPVDAHKFAAWVRAAGCFTNEELHALEFWMFRDAC